MYSKNPSRRDVLKTVAASGALLGTGIGVTGTATAQSSTLSDHLLVFGDGTPTRYQFTVGGHGTVEKTTDPSTTGFDPSLITINSRDTITETTLWGHPVTLVSGVTTNQADAYYFARDRRRFWPQSFWTSQDDVVVFQNGGQHTISEDRYLDHGNYVLFHGNGTRGWYGFTVEHEVSKVTYEMGGPVDPEAITVDRADTITDLGDETLVSGVTTDEGDAYVFTGKIKWIWADPSVTVYFPPVPNLAVRQTGCEEILSLNGDGHITVGNISITNLTDVWLFIRAGGDPMGDGYYIELGPGETTGYSAVLGTHTVSAEVVHPDTEAYVGASALINGHEGSYEVTVTSC